MIKSIIFVVAFIFLGLAFFLKPQGVLAQSCGGTTPVCRTSEIVIAEDPYCGSGTSCVYTGGGTCVACDYVCGDGISETCQPCDTLSYSQCSAVGSCQAQGVWGFCVCIESGGCGWSGPTPTNAPTPTPTSAVTPTNTPTPTPIPSCTLSFSPNPVDVIAGDTATVTANVVPSNGTVDRVDFAIGNTSIATIAPNTDNTSPYQTIVTGVSPGSTGLTASVFMGGVLRCGGAAPIDPVNVTNPGGWWQVSDADVITNANLVSPIPSSCTLPVCNPVFVITPSGGTPGVPSFAGSYDFNSGLGLGTVSSPQGWLAGTTYNAQTDYNYAFFDRQVPGDTVRNVIPAVVTSGYLTAGGTVSPDGYYWFFRTGDLSVEGEPALGAKKAVLFVNGNLTINGNLSLTDGTGFFMAIASGNITVNPGINNAGGPELEGIFVTNQNFVTAVDTTKFDVRGMVTAYGAVDLNRTLSDNTTIPAETFTYAPDLLFNMPPSLNLKRTRWKEVAP